MCLFASLSAPPGPSSQKAPLNRGGSDFCPLFSPPFSVDETHQRGLENGLSVGQQQTARLHQRSRPPHELKDRPAHVRRLQEFGNPALPGRAMGSGRALGPGGAVGPGGALGSGRALPPGGAVGSGRALGSGRAMGCGRAVGSGMALGSDGPWVLVGLWVLLRPLQDGPRLEEALGRAALHWPHRHFLADLPSWIGRDSADTFRSGALLTHRSNQGKQSQHKEEERRIRGRLAEAASPRRDAFADLEGRRRCFRKGTIFQS